MSKRFLEPAVVQLFLFNKKRLEKPRVIGGALAAVGAVLFGCCLLQSFLFVELKQVAPSYLLVDRSYAFVAELDNGADFRGYWRLPDTLPHRILTTTIAAEDRRFFSHPGVDMRAIIRALIHNYVTNGAYSGASTLAMQLCRIQTMHPRAWYYKIRDAFTALWLTMRFGRLAIARHYLTIAPYGNRIAGAAYAAQVYFSKPAQDLSWAESALLASLPHAPGRMNLFSESGFLRAKRRAGRILDVCHDNGWLSNTQVRQGREELGMLRRPVRHERSVAMIHAVFAVQRQLKENAYFTQTINTTSVNPIIRTSLDVRLQERIMDMLWSHRASMEQMDVANCAAMVVDWKKREILTYIGSLNYYDQQHAGAVDCAAAQRSTGSLLKPFIYGLGMERLGYTAATMLTDIGFDFGSGKKSFIPQNFDRAFLGPVLYPTALANSRNVPAVQVLKDVGIYPFYDYCATLGLCPDDGRAEYFGLGMAIGGIYANLFELCRAYCVLPNRGIYADLSFLYETRFPARQIMQPDIAMQLQCFLSDPLIRLPSFPRHGFLEYPFPVAAKTGTSEGFRDAWCIGWSDTYLVGVWMGNPTNAGTKNASGYEAAAPIVQEILSSLHTDRQTGLQDIAFPPPPGYRKFQICRLTGLLADSRTPYTTQQYFKPGTEPTEYSCVEKIVAIDPANGLRKPAGAPGPVTYQRCIVLPEIFTEWANSQGLPIAPSRYSTLDATQYMMDTDTFAIEIVSPRNQSRIFIDPEMPPDANFLTINCRPHPAPDNVLWYVNGQEYAVANYPYHLRWHMQPGTYTFQAVIPYTHASSKPCTVEIF
ncbi:MAG: transglycosylase domain-containing protein [Chitinivibrionales bacterium]|nr:transglycosylase domain-containing protein [Chitinivibrionales bacterium]